MDERERHHQLDRTIEILYIYLVKITRILNKHILKPSGWLGIPIVVGHQKNPNIIFGLVTTLGPLPSYKLKLGIEVQHYLLSDGESLQS